MPGDICPLHHSPANPKAINIISVWVTMITRRRSRWSAARPPHLFISKAGRKLANVPMPIQASESVSSNNTIGIAMPCIWEPMLEISAPTQKRRKSGLRSAFTARRRPDPAI